MDTPDLNADTWDAAAGANRWTLCANSENQLVQVDPIAEANSCTNSYSFRQSGTSQPQNIPSTEEKIVGTATNRPERKRINDKAYRQRQKEGRIKLEDDFCKLQDDFRNLHEENAYLKTENECLKKENCMLKRTISDQQVPVDTFMQKPLVVTQLEDKISLLSAEKEQLLERVKNLENQNQVPRVQVEAFCEQINNVKDNEDIQAWGHVEELPKGHFKCKFCGHDGDSPRIKSHLEGVKGCDIEIGTKVPIDVQAATYLAIGGPNKKAKIMSSLSNFEQSKTDSTSSLSLSNDLRQATLLELCKKKDKSALDKLLTELLLLNYIELNVVQTPAFNRFVQGVAEYGPGYELPSDSTLCMKLIDSRMEVEEYIRNVKKSWVTTGCTLMFQTWSDDCKQEFYTNIIAYSPGGAVFINSCQINDLEDNVVSIITEEIGPDHVVQVITDDDNDFIFYDDVVDMIIGKYPRIYNTRCAAAHGIGRLLEVDWVCRVINYASLIASYMYKHATILSLMRDYTNNRDLKHSCMSRFVCGYQTLKSIYDVANELRLLVRSSQWRGLGYNKDEAKEVTDIIQSTEFWSQGSEVLQALEPLVHVVLLIDNDGPTSGYLYEAMERAKEAIKHRCADNPAKYMQIWELLEGWYTKEIIHPTHAAAAFLNPAYMCRENFREDNMMRAGICFILRNLVDTEEQDDFQSQLEVYRMKNSRLFTSTAMANLKTHHPRIWWEYFGDSLPMVRKYAIRILSQPCSTFLCKRDLNDFEAEHKKQYDKFRPHMFDNLVYTRMNTMMMEKFSTLKARDLKPIDLDKLLVNFDCSQVCGGYCFYGLDFDGNIF